MCGATQQQKDISNEQEAFYKQMTQQDATTFSENQDILKQMQSVYAPILAKGPNQFGFNDAEVNNLNTSATEGVATDYANAAKALRENQAAQGGGNDYLPSGVSAQEQEGLAISGAQQESTDKLNIQQAGYQQGYNEFQAATGALDSASGLNNSVNFAGNANTAGSAAATTANQISQANDSWIAPLMGAVGAVGGAAAGGFAGKKP